MPNPFYFLHPIWDILSLPPRRLSFALRWRLLLLQPIALLTYLMKTIPYALPSSRPYSVIRIPTRTGGTVRALLYLPQSRSPSKPSPLHLDVHGGVWLGGLAEYDAPFCTELVERTGAVVVSTQYRIAPRYLYPAAHEDVDDVVQYLLKNAEKLWNANPNLFTVSGFSVGGNMALGCSLHLAPSTVKGFTGFYTPVDMRLSPWEKPKPPGFPTTDPLSVLLKLFDSYVMDQREDCRVDARMNPILAPLEKLPTHMLFVVAGMDILVDEQVKLVERLKMEVEERKVEKERRVEKMVFPKGLHGWLELPSFAIEEQTRRDAFDAAIMFLQDVHQEHGWDVNEL